MIRLSWKVFGLLLGVCALAGEANAGMIRVGDDAAHIALAQQFDAVGAVRGTNAANVTGHAQSANLIRPDWIIATKHGFVDSANNNSLYTNLSVSFGSNFNDSSTRYGIQSVFLHPTKDIALARLYNAVSGVTPFDIYTGTVTNGMEGYTVGYGKLQYVNDPFSIYTGDRRAGFDVVDGVNLFEPENFRTRINQSFLSNYRPLEMGARLGDSGGGWILADQGNPTNLLAGLIDSGTLTDGFATASYYTRLGEEIGFINGTIAANSDPYSDPTPAVPEPATISMLATGLLLSPFLRRRKKLKA